MKRCSKCNNLMPDDALRCIKCGLQSLEKTKHDVNDSSDASQASTGNAVSTQRIRWMKICAAVLTSNLFVLTSCTGGVVASYISFEKMGGQYMDRGAKPYDGMVVIAAVPNPAKQGTVQLEQLTLRDMEKFKAANPTHSFLLPLGSGRVEIVDAEYSTRYDVQPVGDGKVLVETRHSGGMGGTVIARYEATDKSVRPIFTNKIDWLIALFAGLAFAMILYGIGLVLRYRAAKHAEAQ
jgi:hypothetical protein